MSSHLSLVNLKKEYEIIESSKQLSYFDKEKPAAAQGKNQQQMKNNLSSAHEFNNWINNLKLTHSRHLPSNIRYHTSLSNICLHLNC